MSQRQLALQSGVDHSTISRLIKGDRIQLIVNTPHGAEPWFDEKSIRRAAVTHHVQTITTLAAARAAADGIAALQQGHTSVRALQALHAQRATLR